MKRRELLKIILAGAVISGAEFGLIKKYNTSCNDNIKTSSSAQSLNIIPKQTDIYKITIPLPFNHKLIDEIANLNASAKKYKIVNLYNSIPLPFGEKYELFQSGRGYNEKINSIEKFLEYSRHAADNGLSNVYCINSPNPFTENEFNSFSDDLFYLIEKLSDNGVKKFKIANTELLELLYNKFDVEFQLSTSCEYHNVNQYINLLNNYPKIKLIDISIDENRNFEFLLSMRKIFPNIELELMVDETCLRGCPARISHPSAVHFCVFNCDKIKNANKSEFFMKSSLIYPWYLEYYSALGINSFKFFSRQLRANIQNLDFCKKYLNIVENGIGNQTAKSLNDIIGFELNNRAAKVSLAEFKNYLPNIEYFVKHGHKCAVDCAVNCNYCVDIAKRIEKYFS